ncbi:MAG: hypothetical protein ACHP6H_01305 [Legionellales bacterium]
MIMKRLDEGGKHMDKQDIAIQEIVDQIKGNEDKGITGIRQTLKEHQKVLLIPMLIARIPKSFLIGISIIMVEGLLEMAHAGLITGLIKLFTK